MKKARFIYLSILIIALLARVTQASSTHFSVVDPSQPQKPEKTPGAKATEKAAEKGTEQATEQVEQATEQAAEAAELTPSAEGTESAKGAGKSGKVPGAKATEKAAEKAGKFKGKPEQYKGTLQAADGGSLTLVDALGTSVTIAISAETRIHFPGNAAGSLEPGLTVSVKAYRDENNNLVAGSIQVIPGKPATVHRVGIVTEYNPGVSITIQAQDNQLYTFTLAPDLKILPKKRAEQLAVGSLVTIIAPRNLGSSELIARGIVVHPEGSAQGAFGTATPAP